jgi:hypothetical protein
MAKSVVALVVVLLLAACAWFTPNPQVSVCPPPQFADEKVAEELANVPLEGYEDFWDWISRIERLNETLEAGC